MFEEFDYSLDKRPEDRNQFKLKKAFLIFGVVCTLFLFVYITIGAYRFVSRKPAPEDVILIRASSKDIKEKSNSRDQMSVENEDIEVYDVFEKNNKKLEVKGVKSGSSSTKDLLDQLEISEQQIKSNKALMKNIQETQSPVSQTKKSPVTYKRAQIAALKSKAGAIKYWENKQAKYNSLLGDRQYFIEEADLGAKGVFYRLQVGVFETTSEVKTFCAKYIKATNGNKADCIVIDVK